MIHYTPKFFYSGSKSHGIKSDLVFVKSKLGRLNKENQFIACEAYEEIYKRHFNAGEYRLARLNANKFLNEFANEYGITLQDYQHLQATNDDQAWIDSKIEELKKHQKLSKPRIYLGEKKRANG
ncbi:hypothetical protein [Vibrio algivorus]|uniref:Uncharacterized protein n=1 Tax=Vibrio algivorus TaxID=1667024 RepID=A0A557P9Q3_9VIBR|nr:hypothetical protein [Vibrio algivorus]TVO37368.1 hypothetical protein FOF44_07095 [Vibrio algivorus]